MPPKTVYDRSRDAVYCTGADAHTRTTKHETTPENRPSMGHRIWNGIQNTHTTPYRAVPYHIISYLHERVLDDLDLHLLQDIPDLGRQVPRGRQRHVAKTQFRGRNGKPGAARSGESTVAGAERAWSLASHCKIRQAECLSRLHCPSSSEGARKDIVFSIQKKTTFSWLLRDNSNPTEHFLFVISEMNLPTNMLLPTKSRHEICSKKTYHSNEKNATNTHTHTLMESQKRCKNTKIQIQIQYTVIFNFALQFSSCPGRY